MWTTYWKVKECLRTDCMTKHIEKRMKYKMVVKAGDKVFVKARSKNKEHLEKRAIALTKKKPYITVYVVSEDTYV